MGANPAVNHSERSMNQVLDDIEKGQPNASQDVVEEFKGIALLKRISEDPTSQGAFDRRGPSLAKAFSYDSNEESKDYFFLTQSSIYKRYTTSSGDEWLTKEQLSARNVVEGTDLLSSHIMSAARAQPSVAAHATK